MKYRTLTFLGVEQLDLERQKSKTLRCNARSHTTGFVASRFFPKEPAPLRVEQ
jgi:hypothetical protein